MTLLSFAIGAFFATVALGGLYVCSIPAKAFLRIRKSGDWKAIYVSVAGLVAFAAMTAVAVIFAVALPQLPPDKPAKDMVAPSVNFAIAACYWTFLISGFSVILVGLFACVRKH